MPTPIKLNWVSTLVINRLQCCKKFKVELCHHFLHWKHHFWVCHCHSKSSKQLRSANKEICVTEIAVVKVRHIAVFRGQPLHWQTARMNRMNVFPKLPPYSFNYLLIYPKHRSLKHPKIPLLKYAYNKTASDCDALLDSFYFPCCSVSFSC